LGIPPEVAAPARQLHALVRQAPLLHFPPRYRRHLATAMITNRPRNATAKEPVRDASGEYKTARVMDAGACLTNRA